MGYALLWISSLFFAVLFLTLGFQVAAQRERKWKQWAFAAATLLIIFIPSSTALIATRSIENTFKAVPHWSAYVLAWKIVFTTAGFFLFRFLFWKRKSEPDANAGLISYFRLSSGVVGFGLLTLLIYWQLDIIAYQRLAELKTESNNIISALSPGIVKDSENAAILYQSAFNSINEYHKLHPEVDNLLKGWNDEYNESEEIIAGLDNLSYDLELIRRASLLPHCVFENSVGRSPLEIDYPEISGFRKVVDWLTMDAKRKKSQGDYKGAIVDVATLLRIARHTYFNQSILLFFPKGVIQNSSFSIFQDISIKYSLKGDDVLSIAGLDLYSYQTMFQHSMKMEQAYGLAATASIFTDSKALMDAMNDGSDFSVVNANSDLNTALVTCGCSLFRLFYTKSEIDVYHSLMRDEINSLSVPYYELITQNNNNKKYGVFSSIIANAYREMPKKVAKADAQLKLMRLACAVISYRSANGKYPETLVDMIPQFINYDILDPFDGQMLRYSLYGNGAIVFSIGENGTEDIDIIAKVDDERNANNIILRIGIE